MAIPILNHLDFFKAGEIQNVLLHTTATSSVSSPGTGQIIYDSGTVKVYNGSAWLSLASGGGTRTVAVDTNGDGSVNNTLELGESLVFKKGTGVTIAEAGGVVTIAATGTQLTQEQVEDFVGGMLDGTETGITVGYDDANGNLDFVIGAGDIVHSMLADDAVDADNLASDAVVTASIVDVNVTTAKIADLNVTTGKLAANAVTTAKITDANITMAKLANIATDTFIGRTADNAGVPKALSKAEALAILSVEDGADVTDAANVKAALGGAIASNALQIGNGDTVTTIPGSLTVTGTTTTNNVVTVSTSNGIQFEGAAADGHDAILKSAVATSDKTYTLPNVTGHVALFAADPSTTTISSTPTELNLLDGITTLSGSNTGDEPDSSATVKGIIELATAAETLVGTDAARAVTPDTLAAKSVHATIDHDESNFVSNLFAVIPHGLGTEDVIVQLFDSVTKQQCFAEINRTDKDGTASTAEIKIVFAVAPANDLEVMITSIKGSTVKTPVYTT